MGVSGSPEQLAGKLAGFGSKMPAITRRAVGEACLAAKTIMVAEAGKAGALSLSGVGQRGARIGVFYNVRGGINATGLVQYRGPAHLANNPRRGGYPITPKRKKALSTPYGVKASAVGGATRGKKFYEAAQPKVAAQTPLIFNRELNRGLRSVF